MRPFRSHEVSCSPRGKARGTVAASAGLWALVRTAAVAALAAAAFVVATPVAATAQVAVEDLEVHLQLVRDTAVLTSVVPIKNEEKRPQQVRITVGDWVRDSLGNNVFSEAGSASQHCGRKLSVFPTTFQIAPGATELLRIAYAPGAADDGCWAIVFVETVLPPAPRPDAQGSFLTLELRTGVKVYVHRPDAHRAAIVEAADVAMVWRPVPPRPDGRRDSVHVREATVLVANTGTAHLRIKNTLEIRDAQARLLHTVTGPDAPMTPGSARYIPLRVPTLPPGDYVAIVLLDYGGDEIAAAQVEFKVP